MLAWLDQALICLEQNTDIVLITVAQTRGSVPRNAATHMLVSKHMQWLTIGGGNLEWQATAKAKEYLQLVDLAKSLPEHNHIIFTQQQDNYLSYNKTNIWFDIFQLGPSLGQCCGGIVGVVFEYLTQADLPWLKFLQNAGKNDLAIKKELQYIANDLTSNALNSNQAKQNQISLSVITDTAQKIAANAIYHDATHAQLAGGRSELCTFERHADGSFLYTEILQTEPFNIYVFGAGHVGKALVNLLGTLPCNVVWVDSRAEQFSPTVAANVTIEETDIPESIIEAAAPNSCFVIMTHDHALDQRLCEQLLKRDDALYFGLIGSHTKRNKFEHRFKAKGIESARYEKIVCPIGIPSIKGKQPAIIALAVAAQLMCLREGHLYAP